MIRGVPLYLQEALRHVIMSLLISLLGVFIQAPVDLLASLAAVSMNADVLLTFLIVRWWK